MAGKNSSDEVCNYLATEGFSPEDIKLIETGLCTKSIEGHLRPKVQWLLELGLSKTQVAKAVAGFPPILGLSMEPMVEWLLELGLSKMEVAKAGSPTILVYSIKQNLKPTVKWLLELGLSKSEVTIQVACFPRFLDAVLRKT